MHRGPHWNGVSSRRGRSVWTTAYEEQVEPGLAGFHQPRIKFKLFSGCLTMHVYSSFSRDKDLDLTLFYWTNPGDLYLEVGRRCSQLSSVTLVRGE